MKPRARIAVALPSATLLFSFSMFALSAFSSYHHLKNAEQPGTNYISIGQFAFPKNRLPWIVLTGTAIEVHGPIAGFNVPGVAIDGLAKSMLGRYGSWSQDRLGLHLWRVLTSPLLALPAWWFVGRGFDGLAGNARMRRLDLIVGSALSIIACVLSAGLRFGLSDSEREGQDSLTWFIGGLALWTLLFAIPAIAWVRAKIKQSRAEKGNSPAVA